jgi:glycosyltransferase involved in cell wall biosynthesis
MVREKGIHVLLEAAVHIRAAVPDVRFVLIGRGPMEDTLRHQAHRLGLDGAVDFLGFVSDADRDAWLQAADVCVFPSLYEPFGIVALEAMAAGIAVVVSDTGGLREIVTHEVTGLTAYPGHAMSLADQTVRLLQDRDLAENLARRARAMVRERYAWQTVAARTAEVYEHVLQSVRHEEAPTG